MDRRTLANATRRSIRATGGPEVLPLCPIRDTLRMGGPNMPKVKGKTILPAVGPTKLGGKPVPPIGARAAPKAKAGKSDMIRARVSPELRAKAEAIFAKLGMNTSDAIRLFYSQVVLRKGLPFDVRIPNAATAKALRAADRGEGLTRYEDVDAMMRDIGV
jgi:DNA-damage-inducible protein J